MSRRRTLIRMRIPTRCALALGLGVVVATGCAVSDVGRALYGRNESDQTLVIWFRSAPSEGAPDEEPEVRKWLLPPRTSGIALPIGLGSLDGTVGLSDLACNVLDAWESRFGGTLVVAETGVADFHAENQGAPPPPDEGAVLLDVAPTSCR